MSSRKHSLWLHYGISAGIVLLALLTVAWYATDRFHEFFVSHLQGTLQSRAIIVDQEITASGMQSACLILPFFTCTAYFYWSARSCIYLSLFIYCLCLNTTFLSCLLVTPNCSKTSALTAKNQRMARRFSVFSANLGFTLIVKE